jgi:hypothetical protein
MKWLSQITCFLLLVAPAITASASQELPDRSDPQVLIALEQSWNEAVTSQVVVYKAGTR